MHKITNTEWKNLVHLKMHDQKTIAVRSRIASMGDSRAFSTIKITFIEATHTRVDRHTVIRWKQNVKSFSIWSSDRVKNANRFKLKISIQCTCWWALWKGDPLKLHEDDIPPNRTMRQCSECFVYKSAPRVPLVCLSTTWGGWWIQLLNSSQYSYLQLYNAAFTALSVTHNSDNPCGIRSPRSLSCTANPNMIYSYQLITLGKSESRKELLFKDTFMNLSWC